MSQSLTRLQAAAAHYREGKFAAAESLYASAVATDEKKSAALERLGEIALHSNRPAEALRLLRKAEQCAPMLMRVWPLSLQHTQSMAGGVSHEFFRRSAVTVDFDEMKLTAIT